MSDNGIRIRNASPADAEAIAALLTQLGYPINPEELPARMSEVVAHGGSIVLAEGAEKSPLGLMCLTRHWGLHTTGPTAYIMALVTSENARRRGVGKALVEYAKQWGRDNGCEKITVTSAEHREGAHAFYPAMGMPYTGRRFSAKIDNSVE